MASSTASGRELAQPFHQAVAQPVARHALARDADQAELVRQEIAGREVIERGHDQPVREIAGHAENDEGAGIGFLLRYLTDRHDAQAFVPGFFGGSLWPPKPARIADRIFSAKV